jgi:hypothetical protein
MLNLVKLEIIEEEKKDQTNTNRDDEKTQV